MSKFGKINLKASTANKVIESDSDNNLIGNRNISTSFASAGSSDLLTKAAIESGSVGAVSGDIQYLSGIIDQNTDNINSNDLDISYLSGRIDINTSSVNYLSGEIDAITSNVTYLSGQIDINTSNITSNDLDIDYLSGQIDINSDAIGILELSASSWDSKINSNTVQIGINEDNINVNAANIDYLSGQIDSSITYESIKLMYTVNSGAIGIDYLYATPTTIPFNQVIGDTPTWFNSNTGGTFNLDSGDYQVDLDFQYYPADGSQYNILSEVYNESVSAVVDYNIHNTRSVIDYEWMLTTKTFSLSATTDIEARVTNGNTVTNVKGIAGAAQIGFGSEYPNSPHANIKITKIN